MPAKATGNDRFDAWPNRNDWYETIKLNYGVDYLHHTGGHFDPIPDTWKKMEDILSYWAGKGIDGFRCDMAEWYLANSGDGSFRASRLHSRRLSLLPKYTTRMNTVTIFTTDISITCMIR